MCNKYKNIRKPALLALLTPQRKLQLSRSAIRFSLLISLKFPCIHSELPDGTVVAQHDNQAVPHTRDLRLEEKATIEDAVECLRLNTFTPGYAFNT